MAAPSSWRRARYELGLSPTSSVNRVLNDPSDAYTAEVKAAADSASVPDN